MIGQIKRERFIKIGTRTVYPSVTLNYILYLKNKNEDSLVKQSFLMSLGLHSAGKNSFHSNRMKLSECFNLNNFNPDLLDAAKIKHFLSLMKQKYISYWQQALQHSQKLEFYKIFKKEYVPWLIQDKHNIFFKQ